MWDVYRLQSRDNKNMNAQEKAEFVKAAKEYPRCVCGHFLGLTCGRGEPCGGCWKLPSDCECLGGPMNHRQNV